MNEGLGGSVDISARIGPLTGSRSEINDVAAIALHHSGKQKPGAVDQSFDVAVNHRVPIVESGLLGRLEADGSSGIIHEDIHFGECGGQIRDGMLDFATPAHIEDQWEKVFSQFPFEILQPVLAAAS